LRHNLAQTSEYFPIGNISTDWVNKIQELSLEQLEDLGEALLDFTSQSDLINWFNYLEENKKNIR